MKQSQLYEKIAQCLAFGDSPEFMKAHLMPNSEPKFSQDLVFMASNHYVLPALFLRIVKSNTTGFFPDELKDHLNEILELNRKRNRLILEQIREINAVLGDENIYPVYLKGTANLLDNLYSDPGERMIGDIDLLVREEEYLKAVEKIKSLGYRYDRKILGDVGELKHYPRLYREDVPADVEIHRLPVNTKYTRKFTTEMVFAHKREAQSSSNVFVPSDEHKIILNFIHGQLSNQGFRFRMVPLRDLFDLYLLSQRVDLVQVLPFVEERHKAAAYFCFSERVFGLQTKPTICSGRKYSQFYRQHHWLLNHHKISRFRKGTIKLLQLIVVRYFWRIFSTLFSKSSRRHVWMRVKDPQWYKLHWKGLHDYFK